MARNLIKSDRTECPTCGHNHSVHLLWAYYDTNARYSAVFPCEGCGTKFIISLNVNGYIVLRNVKTRKPKV